MRALRAGTLATLQLVFVTALGWSQAQNLTCPRPIPKDFSSGRPPDLCDKVYQVTCTPRSSDGLISSGFLARSGEQVGILTTLHGVVGCRSSDANLTAINGASQVIDLVLAKVDIKRDLAFLTNKQSAKNRLPSNFYLRVDDGYENELKQPIRTELRVVGYPQGIGMQLGIAVSPQDNPLVNLQYLLPQAELGKYLERNSPGINQRVLSLSGPIQSGFSGAPVLNREGEVVAVADGGLGAGSEIGWAIPYSQVELKDTNSPENNFTTLSKTDELLTSYVQSAPAPALYFADSREAPRSYPQASRRRGHRGLPPAK